MSHAWVIVKIMTSFSVRQFQLLQTRNSALSLERNINSSVKLKPCYYFKNKIKIVLSLSLTAIEHSAKLTSVA